MSQIISSCEVSSTTTQKAKNKKQMRLCKFNTNYLRISTKSLIFASELHKV